MDKAASRIRLRNCSPFTYQKGYSCKANEVQMKNDAAFATLKTIKNRTENLYNQFLFCNSFLLLVLYLHGDYGK